MFFPEIWEKSDVLKYLSVNFEIMAFFKTVTGR